MRTGIMYFLMQVYNPTYEAVFLKRWNINLIKTPDLYTDLQKIKETKKHTKGHHWEILSKAKHGKFKRTITFLFQ